MKYFLMLLTVLVFVACARIDGVYATYPQDAVLCSKDPDCFEGQYCGFVPGYTAAVCRGQATGPMKNFHDKMPERLNYGR